MARIIGGSMIGELSGKLGGNVFARNKAGAYIRQYVIPVNPNTLAQSNARSAFGTSSSSYHSLTSVIKNQWTNFAQNLYLPKNGINTGQYSGFSAFTALRNTAQNALRLVEGTPVVKVNAVANTITDLNIFSPVDIPPVASIQGNLALAGGTGTIQPILASATVDDFANFSFQLTMGSDSMPVPTNIDPELKNGAGQLIGFSVYMSNPVQQQQMFIANPEKFLLGTIPNFTLATGTGTGVTSIDIDGQVVFPDSYQAWPQPGEFVRITVYMTTLEGQTIRIGSVITQIQPHS